MTRPIEDPRSPVLPALVAFAAIGAAAVLLPLLVPLVLAAWLVEVTSSVIDRLERALHSRKAAAAVATLLVTVAFVAPVTLAVIALVDASSDLLAGLKTAVAENRPLSSLLTISTPRSPGTLLDMLESHSERVFSLGASVFRATAGFVVSIFVLLLGYFALAIDAQRAHEWLAHHIPIDRPAFERFARAFQETGRGLLVGTGLTGVVQGVIAGLAYFALGVPSAFALSLFTVIASFVPSVGTGLVWVPVAAGLAIAGEVGRAAILVAIGVGVVSVIDNILRPWLTRYGHLELPTFVVLVAMLGGIALFGASGLVIGPLLVRLGLEALRIARERQLFAKRRRETAPVEHYPHRLTTRAAAYSRGRGKSTALT